MKKNNEKTITISEAYRAMFTFLDMYYDRTNIEEIGSLLGDMHITKDNRTIDPAVWDDWLEAIKRSRIDNLEKQLKFLSAVVKLCFTQ